jgi:hypothetical protein
MYTSKTIMWLARLLKVKWLLHPPLTLPKHDKHHKMNKIKERKKGEGGSSTDSINLHWPLEYSVQ